MPPLPSLSLQATGIGFDEAGKGAFIASEIMENIANRAQILVADDEPAVALAIKSALKFCGYPVSIASNGTSALECLRAEPDRFSVVLSDLNMPGLSGIALVKALAPCAIRAGSLFFRRT